MSDSSMTHDELRKQATKRIKAKQAFWRLAGIFAIVWVIMIGVWWLSEPRGHFWPTWAIFGMGIALPVRRLGRLRPAGPGHRRPGRRRDAQDAGRLLIDPCSGHGSRQ